MDIQGIIFVSVISVLTVQILAGFIWYLSRHGDKKAADKKCVRWMTFIDIVFKIIFILGILMTVVVLIASIVYLVALNVENAPADAVPDMLYAQIGTVVLDVIAITIEYLFSKKIYYNENTITVVGIFRKKKTYEIADITDVRDSVQVFNDTNTLGMTQRKAQGRLVLYFGKKRVSASSFMMGIEEFRKTIYHKRPDLKPKNK